MGLSANMRDNKLFIVKIADKSPAHKANIKIGDQIISIDGSNYENISEEQYCKLLQSGGLFGESDSINIEWLSKDEKKNVILKKEKLL
jgi:C-terminal processing protease CtpA/Prc